MKLVQVLAVANATLAVASALLGAAPFTPAIFFFVIYAPLACVFAVLNQAVAALVVAGAFVVAWFLSPIRYAPPFPQQLTWLFGWVVFCCALAAVLSVGKVRAALFTYLRVGTSAAC
jgi:hypothetical protein